MSLDVYLVSPETVKCSNCGHLVTVGQEHTVFDYNITHNLAKMASEAGIYKHLWRPDELEIDTAKQLIEPLTNGLKELQNNPDKYEKLNPPNGWGNYDGLVAFVAAYLTACKQYPEAKIKIWR